MLAAEGIGVAFRGMTNPTKDPSHHAVPEVSDDVRAVIAKHLQDIVNRENGSVDDVHGELLKLGVDVDREAVRHVAFELGIILDADPERKPLNE